MSDQVQFRGGTTVQHSIFTGAAREMTIDTTKNVVVVHDGATVGGHPMARTDGANTFVGNQAITGTLSASGVIGATGVNPTLFGANGTEQARIDTNGNLGLGVTPSAWSGYTALEFNKGAYPSSALASSGGNLDLTCNSYYNTGYKYQNGTTYYATRYTQNAVNGSHTWWSAGVGTATNPITFTQAMTLDASGHLGLAGGTSAGNYLSIQSDTSIVGGTIVKDTGTSYGTSNYYHIFTNSSNTIVGGIQHTGTTTVAYYSASDKRLKKDLGVCTDTSVIDNTVIHDYEWVNGGSKDRGVFAQDAYLIKPSAITVGKDDLTEDGSIREPWGVDYAKYVPDLIVKCQQLSAQVTTLQSRIATLEGKLP